MSYMYDHCTYTEDSKYYIFTGPCKLTGKKHTVKVPKDELYAYNQGAYIQNAMKSVSAEDREFLLSGYTQEAWDKLFREPL